MGYLQSALLIDVLCVSNCCPLPPALGGNLGGCTSFLLGLDGGQLAGRLRADVLIPVRGIKRCVYGSGGSGFGELLEPVTGTRP